ncbi:MAG TPA: hypothetical protein VGH28_00230 [Polyangiaceae bacterium]
MSVVFAVVAFAIAGWLFPRWRRMRRRRIHRPEYAFVTLNVFGGALLGVALLVQPVRSVIAQRHRDAVQERLAKHAVRCDGGVIELRRRDDGVLTSTAPGSSPDLDTQTECTSEGP